MNENVTHLKYAAESSAHLQHIIYNGTNRIAPLLYLPQVASFRNADSTRFCW